MKGLPKKAVVLAVIAWLPLLVLTIIEGSAFSGSTIPFLNDLATHVRCLIAIPILVLAEVPIRHRIDMMVSYASDAGLVIGVDRDRFTGFVDEARSINRSWWTWIGLLIVTYLTIYLAHSVTRLATGQIWYERSADLGYSLAGLYFLIMTLPVFNFLVYRWLFRIVLGTRCLWQISRLKLNLTPTHPDGSGGLGFVGRSVVHFGFVLFALSCVVSAGVASRVLFAGDTVTQFGFTYAALIVLTIIFLSIPLFVFVPKLVRLKQNGLLTYGVLASHYTQRFESKWIGQSKQSNESLLGSADIQSLADLGGGYEVVRKMRIIPIELKDFAAIVVLGIIPAVPLAVLVMPVSQILKGILSLLV